MSSITTSVAPSRRSRSRAATSSARPSPESAIGGGQSDRPEAAGAGCLGTPEHRPAGRPGRGGVDPGEAVDPAVLRAQNEQVGRVAAGVEEPADVVPPLAAELSQDEPEQVRPIARPGRPEGEPGLVEDRRRGVDLEPGDVPAEVERAVAHRRRTRGPTGTVRLRSGRPARPATGRTGRPQRRPAPHGPGSRPGPPFRRGSGRARAAATTARRPSPAAGPPAQVGRARGGCPGRCPGEGEPDDAGRRPRPPRRRTAVVGFAASVSSSTSGRSG